MDVPQLSVGAGALKESSGGEDKHITLKPRVRLTRPTAPELLSQVVPRETKVESLRSQTGAAVEATCV